MSDLWKKLNLSDQEDIVVLGAPASFEPALEALEGRVTVRRRLTGKSRFSYLVAFVTKRSEIAELAPGLSDQAVGDAILWLALAYPKSSSKRYSCDFSRDSGWEPIGEAGFEGVRQIAPMKRRLPSGGGGRSPSAWSRDALPGREVIWASVRGDGMRRLVRRSSAYDCESPEDSCTYAGS